VSALWEKHWFDEAIRSRTRLLWRGVEAQHQVATLALVRTLPEQRVLEELLEESKPALPPATAGLHYLLATPFRYRAPVASRFRRAHDAGLWYGAEELRTACAEVAYWKWRFLMDSDGLCDGALHTTHTFFQARTRGRCIDLSAPPWNVHLSTWRHGADYSACQALAEEARAHDVAWIRYASARIERGSCGAVLRPKALTLPTPLMQQTWTCRTARDGAWLRSQSDPASSVEFAAHSWA
jgi:hypothetical protein